MHMDTPAAQGILQRYLGPAGLHSWKEACLKEEGWSPWQGWYGFLVAKKHIPTYDDQELGCTLLHWAVSHFNDYFWGSTFHLCGSACQRGCDPWSWSLLSQLDSTICRIVGATFTTMVSETWNHQTALGKTHPAPPLWGRALPNQSAVPARVLGSILRKTSQRQRAGGPNTWNMKDTRRDGK